MSLKAAHLIFVGALTALSFGASVWKFKDYFGATGRTADLLFAIGALIAGVAVIAYGRLFLKKMKSFGYL